MPALRIHLFSRFSIECDGRSIGSLDTKAQRLLAFLLLHRDRAHSRESLADMLWDETETDVSKKYLRQALWQLHAALSGGGSKNDSWVLAVEPDWIRIDLSADVWLDTWELESAFARSQQRSAGTLKADDIRALEGAVCLYRGDLLQDCYQDWCIFERERFQSMYLSILDKLMDYCGLHGCYEDAIDYGTRVLRYDHAQERTHRKLMRLHYLNGDRSAALRQYERCMRALKDELGVDPGHNTTGLYERIRANESVLPETAPNLLHSIRTRLEELRTDLVSVQLRVEREIKHIDAAIEETIKPEGSQLR